ncbi:MAG: thioredoxin family protein [Pleurocapsa sp. SU_196_0]|nr:thioredoxin family protein [Pleurocapsa sp. SU_196_0]
MKKLMLGLAGVFALSGAFAQDTMMKSGYVEYSQKAFDSAVKMKRVLFFAASWCPSCRGADKDINSKLKTIPENLVIFKTDYDSQTALKTKYGITSQHTFVYVDAKGAALKKWSGGGLAEIVKAVDSMK